MPTTLTAEIRRKMIPDPLEWLEHQSIIY